jgi:hypothetical protein
MQPQIVQLSLFLRIRVSPLHCASSSSSLEGSRDFKCLEFAPQPISNNKFGFLNGNIKFTEGKMGLEVLASTGERADILATRDPLHICIEVRSWKKLKH